MWKNPKLWALGVLLALGGASLIGGLGHAASDTFEGTWYADIRGLAFRIELRQEGNGLVGSAATQMRGEAPVPYQVMKAEQAGDTLRLELSGPSVGGMPGEITIELHVPKDELIGALLVEQGSQGTVELPLVMSKDAPELVARFAGVDPVTGEPITRASSPRLRASCANNLKQLGLVMKMFANESRGAKYPMPNRLKLLKEDVYPEYFSDTNVLMCPADDAAPEEGLSDAEKAQWSFDHSRYWYISHAIGDEEQAQAYLEAIRKVLESGDGNLDIDLDTPNRSPAKIYRLREGIERFLITDINQPRGASITRSTMPVLIERPGTHEPDGGNVLYLDGHVEYIKYPGKFPMTEAFIEGLMSLDALARGN